MSRVLLPLLFLLCARCFCTSAVFVITPDRIVGGIDRLAVTPGPNGTLIKKGKITKIALLKGRFIVASIGLETLMDFGFLKWIGNVESKIAPDTSVLQLVSIIENESSRAFTETFPIETFMRNGTLKYSDAMKQFLVQYVIAGFDGRIATLVEVHYELDWKGNRLIGPTRQVQIPNRSGKKAALYRDGIREETDKLRDHKSYAYQRMSVIAPTALPKLLADQPTTKAEAVQSVRALIGIEAEVEPSKVGCGSTVVVLPVNGRGVISEYDTAPSLPKARNNINKKAQQKNR